MEKQMLLIMGFLFCFVFTGDVIGRWNSDTRQDEHSLVTARKVWGIANFCTSSGTEPSALATDTRTFQTINTAIDAAASGNDEIEFYSIPPWANALKITAIGLTDDGTYTVDIHAGTLGKTAVNAIADGTDCHMTYVGTLAFTIGQQVFTDASFTMATVVTATQGDWTKNWGTAGTSGSDRTTETSIDITGADVLAIVPTTCSADSKLLIKGY